MRLSRLLLAVIAGVVILALPATGHGPVGAVPAPGSTVGGEVDEVAIVFSERMSPDGMFISVSGPHGDAVRTRSGVTLDDNEQVARLRFDPLTEPGEYRVNYRISGVDGVTTPGVYIFDFQPSASPPVSIPIPELAAGGANWTAFALGLVVTGLILAVYSRKVGRGR